MKMQTAWRTAAIAVALTMTAASWAGAAAKTNGKMYGYVDQEAGQTFVPIRFFSEQSGASVQWDSGAKRVTIVKDDLKVTLTVGRKSADANGKTLELAAAPFSEGGVTYVPLRVVTEALGLDAKWNSSLASVQLRQADRVVKLPAVEMGTHPASQTAFKRESRSFRVGSRTIKAEMLTVSLLAPGVDLSVALAGGKVGSTEELKGIAKRAGALAAMNGTFFDAYTDSSVKNPYGYIATGGKIVWTAPGENRTVLAFDENNNVEFVDGLDFAKRFEQGDLEGALQAGPRLVRDGKVAVDVKTEGFRDPKILTGGGARSAVGVTKDHKLILATVSGATIPQMAQIMKQAGALQAMNLDGGASSGLYYNGQYVTKPGRLISNALVILQS